jgi:hypothetical protein
MNRDLDRESVPQARWLPEKLGFERHAGASGVSFPENPARDVIWPGIAKHHASEGSFACRGG